MGGWVESTAMKVDVGIVAIYTLKNKINISLPDVEMLRVPMMTPVMVFLFVIFLLCKWSFSL